MMTPDQSVFNAMFGNPSDSKAHKAILVMIDESSVGQHIYKSFDEAYSFMTNRCNQVLKENGLYTATLDRNHAIIKLGNKTVVQWHIVTLNETGDHISSMLTISTAHIDNDTAKILTSDPDRLASVSVYAKGDCGWFLYISEEDIQPETKCLTDIINYARTVGADVVCLDNDGATISELSTYDWDD